jgi:hypothetical protein
LLSFNFAVVFSSTYFRFTDFFLVLCASTTGAGGIGVPLVLVHYNIDVSVRCPNDIEIAYNLPVLGGNGNMLKKKRQQN